MSKHAFSGADILLPKKDFDKWAVIACDQFTSEQNYWDEVEKTVGDHPSTLRITLPEIYLESDGVEERIRKINETMKDYLSSGVLAEHKNTMVYVERAQSDGRIRHGIVGAIDLADYDYRKGSKALVRATEQTVIERIPPRVRIRRDACLELPHVLLLIDDPEKSVIEPLAEAKKTMECAYNTELMMGGGHIEGYFLSPEQVERVGAALDALVNGLTDKLLFAVGDGNHSLATAKECAALNDSPLAAQTIVEIVNVHDPAIEFEPIYRVLFGVNEEELLSDFLAAVGGEYDGEDGQDFDYVTSGVTKTVRVKPMAKLPVGTLQPFLDKWLKEHPGVKIDYIHGEEVVFDLCKTRGNAGFIFKGMGKNELFDAIKADGSLPRKTFSMGHARDKRYYMETRKIR
ncbi:MAG: DUF1015 domain-containing protein [Clostridia bacterium]|nr:DUF1015 domain-containing protein [Clostridia bacterium]